MVLVSGGAKDIGAECALALARDTRCKARFVGPLAPRRARGNCQFSRLRAGGIMLGYESADVTDRCAVAAAVARVGKLAWPVTGVLHAAGVHKPIPALASTTHS